MVFGGMPLLAGGLVHASFRVSGHIVDVNVGMAILDLASKLRAAELGHDGVGEENVDRAGMLAGALESVRGALRLQNLMAGRAQGDFVIDGKNCERA